MKKMFLLTLLTMLFGCAAQKAVAQPSEQNFPAEQSVKQISARSVEVAVGHGSPLKLVVNFNAKWFLLPPELTPPGCLLAIANLESKARIGISAAEVWSTDMVKVKAYLAKKNGYTISAIANSTDGRTASFTFKGTETGFIFKRAEEIGGAYTARSLPPTPRQVTFSFEGSWLAKFDKQMAQEYVTVVNGITFK